MGIIDCQHAANHLLFEPFADVTLMGSRSLGEFARSSGAITGKRAVQTKLKAHVHRRYIECTKPGLENLLTNASRASVSVPASTVTLISTLLAFLSVTPQPCTRYPNLAFSMEPSHVRRRDGSYLAAGCR